MAAGRDIDEAIDGAVARVRDAAESELRAVVSRLQEESVAAQEEAAAAQEEAARATEADAVAIGRESARDAVARLLDAVRRLDGESTLTGVLDTLADLAAAGAGRAALFVKAGGELRGWRFVGFGSESGDAPDHVVNGADCGLLGRAIAERETQVLAAGDDDGSGDGDRDASTAGEPPPFAALPAGCGAVAVPVLVGGEPLVAIYADNAPPAGGGEAADGSSHPHWTGVVELLARHAGSRLEALTANRAAEMAGRTE